MYRNDFVTNTQNSYAAHVAQARMLPLWVACIFFFLMLFALFLSTEYLYALGAAELALRGWDGVLTASERVRMYIIAGGICALSVFLFHFALRWLRWAPGFRTGVMVLAVTSAVVLSQPIIALLFELPLGNTLEADGEGRLSLQNKLLTGGFVVRSVAILLAAVAAASVTNSAWDMAVLAWQARKSGQDAKVLAEAIHDFDDGFREYERLPEVAEAHCIANATDGARAISAGLRSMSNTVIRYLETGSSPFLTGPQWADQVQAQFEEAIEPRDPAVRHLVRDRLEQLAIDLQALPKTPALLNQTTRDQLATYAGWLQDQADMGRILAEIIPSLET